MKTTGQGNPAALVTASNTSGSGKLSDADIKRLCNGQYYMRQSGITNANAGRLCTASYSTISTPLLIMSS